MTTESRPEAAPDTALSTVAMEERAPTKRAPSSQTVWVIRDRITRKRFISLTRPRRHAGGVEFHGWPAEVWPRGDGRQMVGLALTDGDDRDFDLPGKEIEFYTAPRWWRLPGKVITLLAERAA